MPQETQHCCQKWDNKNASAILLCAILYVIFKTQVLTLNDILEGDGSLESEKPKSRYYLHNRSIIITLLM